MKKMFFAGAALAALAAAPAAAQPGEGRGRFAQPQTRESVVDRIEARFARADSNRDGFVTRDEVRARAEARRGQRFAHRGGMRGGFGGRGFAMLDLDRDGRIALAEARSAALRRFDRLDSNRDGAISLDERQSARAARMERREGRED